MSAPSRRGASGRRQGAGGGPCGHRNCLITKPSDSLSSRFNKLAPMYTSKIKTSGTRKVPLGKGPLEVLAPVQFRTVFTIHCGLASFSKRFFQFCTPQVKVKMFHIAMFKTFS